MTSQLQRNTRSKHWIPASLIETLTIAPCNRCRRPDSGRLDTLVCYNSLVPSLRPPPGPHPPCPLLPYPSVSTLPHPQSTGWGRRPGWGCWRYCWSSSDFRDCRSRPDMGRRPSDGGRRVSSEFYTFLRLNSTNLTLGSLKCSFDSREGM